MDELLLKCESIKVGQIAGELNVGTGMEYVWLEIGHQLIQHGDHPSQWVF